MLIVKLERLRVTQENANIKKRVYEAFSKCRM